MREAVPRPRASEWQKLLLEAEDLPVHLTAVRQDIAQALQQQQQVEGELAAALASPETAASLTQLRELQTRASSCSVYISCLGDTEKRLQQLQQVEAAAALHLQAEDKPRVELQQFVEQQEQLLQLPEHTPDLPWFTRLKDACKAVSRWIEETDQLHARGVSLRQWQQHVRRGQSLRIKPEGLQELQEQLQQSADWCVVYQHLLELRATVRCHSASAAAGVIAEMLQDSSGPLTILPPGAAEAAAAAAAAAAATPGLQQEQQGTRVRGYVSLLDAERLTRKPFGLGKSLLPFAELQQHVKTAQQLRERCAAALQQSYRERAACLFGIAAGVDPQPDFASPISESQVLFLFRQQQKAAAELAGDAAAGIAAAVAAAEGVGEQQQQQRLLLLQREQEQQILALQLLSPDAANALLWRTTRRLRRLAAACAASRIHIKERRLLKVEVRIHRMHAQGVPCSWFLFGKWRRGSVLSGHMRLLLLLLLLLQVLLRLYNHRMLSLLRCPRHTLAEAEQLLQQVRRPFGSL